MSEKIWSIIWKMDVFISYIAEDIMEIRNETRYPPLLAGIFQIKEFT